MGIAAAQSAGAGTGAAGTRAKTVGSFGLTMQTCLVARLLAFSLALTVASLFWSAKSQDDIAIDSSRHLARTALDVQIGQLQKALTDFTYWDEAYQKTVETFDPGWFDANIGNGPYLADTFGIASSAIIAPDNSVLRHMQNSVNADGGQTSNVDAYRQGGLDKLIEEARHTVDGKVPAAGGIGATISIELPAHRVVVPNAA